MEKENTPQFIIQILNYYHFLLIQKNLNILETEKVGIAL